MLNLETTSIKVLEESYKSAHVSNIVLSIVLAVIGIGILIWISNSYDTYDSYPFITLIASILIAISLVNFLMGHAPYYDIKSRIATN